MRKPCGVAGAAVVRDVRRQQGDRGAQRAVLVPVEVVADGAVVDDQQRPRLVGVHRVGVLGELGVEDLHDARAPAGARRRDRAAGTCKNVQDRRRRRPAHDSARVRFDTKIAVLLRDDLEPWQRLNVTAFLVSGIAADPELIGEPYADADGIAVPADVPPAGAGLRRATRRC